MTCTSFTIPQLCSSFRLLLTFERATSSVSTISSAFRGFGEIYSRAWICATVRLIPQRVPISPQWRMNLVATGERRSTAVPLFLSKQNIQNDGERVKRRTCEKPRGGDRGGFTESRLWMGYLGLSPGRLLGLLDQDELPVLV